MMIRCDKPLSAREHVYRVVHETTLNMARIHSARLNQQFLYGSRRKRDLKAFLDDDPKLYLDKSPEFWKSFARDMFDKPRVILKVVPSAALRDRRVNVRQVANGFIHTIRFDYCCSNVQKEKFRIRSRRRKLGASGLAEAEKCE